MSQPQKYYCLTIEEVVDSLIESKKNSLRVFSEKKTEYQTMIEKLLQNKVNQSDEGGKDSYQVLMGRDAINSKIKRIFSKAQEAVTLMLSDKNLVNLYHAELTDKLIELTKKGVQVKLQTSCKNFLEYIQLEKGSKESSNLQMKTTSDTAESLPVNFIIVDNKELVILFDNAQSNNSKRETSAFYTSNIQMVATFRFMSENLI